MRLKELTEMNNRYECKKPHLWKILKMNLDAFKKWYIAISRISSCVIILQNHAQTWKTI